ncbi:MAG: glycosyltransferase family 2 protein [Flavobacteriaceae bacterium]|nr:glycosyltransferase family 2 protein [Flavobacteriaceae bacterium]
MQLSVIIVNYNVRYFLELCLQSVQEACETIDAEIIVVDNDSKDDSCKMVVSNFPKVTLIENKENTGFSKANNQGVAIAKGEYILILNPDTVVGKDTFLKCLNFVEKQEKFGALGVKLIDGTGNFLPESKRGIPTPKVSFYKMIGANSETGKYYANHLKEDETGEVDILVGAFMLMKRSVYNEVKGFDERYFMYGEDIDLSYKIVKKGYQNCYLGSVEVIHYKGESTINDVKYLRHFYKAMEIFYKEHFGVNMFYDFMMKLGIKFWYVLKFFGLKKKKKTGFSLKNTLYLGADIGFFTSLKNQKKISKLIKFEEGVTIKQIFKSIEKNQINQIIFDNNNQSYQEIIEQIALLKNKKRTFKVRPKNTNYILGSDSSESKGEVIILE